MTAFLMQAGHFCPFGVMLVKDRVNRAKGWERGGGGGQPLWRVLKYFIIDFCIAQSLFSPLHSCHLHVTVINALHPHPSLHITVMLCHHHPRRPSGSQISVSATRKPSLTNMSGKISSVIVLVHSRFLPFTTLDCGSAQLLKGLF